MISNRRYWSLLALLALVYLAGLFVSLIENDSAQFAVMAKRMVMENDFLNLIKGTEDYLDKPHLHYWLAALSFTLFGIEEWAYRLPALATTILGAYSCFRLGKLLYSRDVGKIASLVFLSAQTIILSNIDVRTDAVLTGLTIFAIWQLCAYVEEGKIHNIILGALGAGLAFSTKGQIAILVIAIPLLVHLAFTGKWRVLRSWKLLVAIVVFILSISPMLYAYYQQFDLHPEKVIRGKSDRSGVLFILWEQSFERLSGEGMGKNSSDYLFFFHTFLWVFLPWTVLGILAYGYRLKWFWKLKKQAERIPELLTLGGITIIFLIISFAQFKLPHYLNIIIPLFAVLTAGFLLHRSSEAGDKWKNTLLWVQAGIGFLVIIIVNLLVFFVFPKAGIWITVLTISGSILLIGVIFKKGEWMPKIVTVSVLSAVLLNALMNLHFYPELLKYQAGTELAQIVQAKNIPNDKIFKLGPGHSWALDFENQSPLVIANPNELKRIQNPWVYASDDDLLELRKAGLDWDMKFTAEHFRITRLQARFLNPNTRNEVLEYRHLVRLR